MIDGLPQIYSFIFRLASAFNPGFNAVGQYGQHKALEWLDFRRYGNVVDFPLR